MTSELPAIAPGQSTEIALTRDGARSQARHREDRSGTGRYAHAHRNSAVSARAALLGFSHRGWAIRYASFQHATEKIQLTLGDGNGDGKANAGERIAILLPEDDVYRAAELFTNDACVDNTLRAFDDWSKYDNVGASAKYSLPLIKADCPAGHVIHALARVVLPDKPNHIVRYAAIEFPISAVN
jgi:hypothetical protein